MTETHRINIVYVLEPTIVIVTILAIGTNVSVSAVKVPAFATIWTTSITSTLLEYQLLARTQALTMVVIAVLAGFTLAVEMVVVANFLMFYGFGEAYSGCWVGSWKRRVKTFVVSVKDDKLAVCCLLACDVDGLERAFTYGCP